MGVERGDGVARVLDSGHLMSQRRRTVNMGGTHDDEHRDQRSIPTPPGWERSKRWNAARETEGIDVLKSGSCGNSGFTKRTRGALLDINSEKRLSVVVDCPKGM